MNKYNINKEQETGIRYIIDPNAPIDTEGLARIQNKMLEEDSKAMQRQIERNNANLKDWESMDLIPCNANVILLPYEEHPYGQKITVSASGLITGGINDPSLMKNPNSGEQESMKKGIWCCKVVAKGPKCENVEVGDDVYCRFDIAAPIPFGGQGLFAMSEQNLITIVRKKK